MFPSHWERFPSDAFELANCENTLQIFDKLGINKNDLSEKWLRFFSATLQSCPEKRFSVKDLMQILQIVDPAEYDLNEQIAHFMGYVLWQVN